MLFIISILLLVVLVIVTAVIVQSIVKQSQTITSQAAGNIKPTSSPKLVYSPMSLISEYFDYSANPNAPCIQEDSTLSWSASGGLLPGESFVFTPQKPSCGNRAIMSKLVWDNSALQLTSAMPGTPAFFDANDAAASFIGKKITAPNFGNSAQLCMFTDTSAIQPYPFYTFTIKNIGSATAYNVKFTGLDKNDWPSNYYHHCLKGDADHDGWNDAGEELLLHYSYFVSGDYTKRKTFVGSSYLKDHGTLSPNDEIDFYPADFNDDGVVDATDIASISTHINQGNGITLDQRYNPNVSSQAFDWERYDLDGSGFVDQNDLNIVRSLVGQPIPPVTDAIPPTAKITQPFTNSSVTRGTQTLIGLYAWDNLAISKVEIYNNGNLLCSLTDPNAVKLPNPLFSCWWNVPNKPNATYVLTAKAYDAAGNVGTSTSVTVATN